MSVPDPATHLAAAGVAWPDTETWPAGRPLYRCHETRYPANAMHPGPGPDRRWSFFDDPPVPVWYAGQSPETALAETLLHDYGPDHTHLELVPSDYTSRAVTPITPQRDLTLLSLRGPGLLRLRLNARHLTDTGPEQYPQTIAWAQQFHDQIPGIDGLIWMSRPWNTQASVVLFGTRVAETDLRPDDFYTNYLDDLSQPGRGFDWLAACCEAVGVHVIPPPF